MISKLEGLVLDHINTVSNSCLRGYTEIMDNTAIVSVACASVVNVYLATIDREAIVIEPLKKYTEISSAHTHNIHDVMVRRGKKSLQ